MAKNITDELEKSAISFLESVADIFSAGGSPFNLVLDDLQKLLQSTEILNAATLKKHAFNLAKLRSEVAVEIGRSMVEVKGEETIVQLAKPLTISEDSFNLLISIIKHVVYIRPDQYQDQVNTLVKTVESGGKLEDILRDLLNFIIQIREDLWEERSKAFKQISHILESLEATEKDFIGTIGSSHDFMAGSNRDFTTAMETGLMEIGSLVVPGQADLEKLCHQIAVKVSNLQEQVQRKKAADQAQLATLATERKIAEQRLEKSQRDYKEFSRQSHAMLQEIETLRAVSLRDPLTNVYNRRAYDNQIIKTLGAIKTKELNTCSLIVFDVDHFRDFNNTYGHLAGDRVLAYVARLTRESLRSDDLIFRYGGDEFIILMPNSNLNSAVGVAEKVRKNITSVEFKLFKNSDVTVSVGISMGVAEIKPEDNAASFFARADEALYKAKSSGRNQVSSCL